MSNIQKVAVVGLGLLFYLGGGRVVFSKWAITCETNDELVRAEIG